MISSEDVRRVTFEKSMRGYRCDDVDDYLKQVAESMEELSAQNDDLQKKLVVLAQRIDQYRAEEDTLRTTIKRSLMEMYRKHINLISKLPEYKKPEEEPVQTEPTQPAAAPEPVQPAPAEPAYTEPVQPVQTAPQPEEPAQPDARYYDTEKVQQTAAPAEEDTEKVDTVEFAIAPHPEEPEEVAPPVQPAAQPQQEDLPFQPGAGLYDEPPVEKPARKTRKSGTTKRASRKPKAAAEPQEELSSPAFDNFEGVDFDS